MTGYTVHTGSNDKFTNGWDVVFGAKKKVGKKKVAKKKAAAKKVKKSSK
ncbi:MAG: hypothetical protein O3A00_09300 [Planctomycetota bacterium]|nr:hypothetical protein [Planctomycetota bacterium]